jgi:D-alanyl-D-alanine dipeptidase
MKNPHPILSYQDLLKRASGGSTEDFVDAKLYDDTILTLYDKHDMEGYTGNLVFVRETLARKLAAVNELLPNNYRLKIVYGYRHPEVQTKYFVSQKDIIKGQMPNLSEDDLTSYVHNFVAVPEVAGHPTGAAVDLTIVDKNGEELDMGTNIADYSDPEKIKTFTENLTKDQRNNRKLLHNLMVQQEFAPFYGEWWHFSYGDREWAAFYNKPRAIYGLINFTG